MLRYGNISQINASKGLARVHFDDVDIVSGWLPIIVPRTNTDKQVDPMEEGEHVACLMDSRDENGVILGAIYSTQDIPPTDAGADTFIRKFADGTIIKYDRGATHEYSITNDTLTFKMNRTGGFEISKGTESLKKIINDLAQECETMTMPVSGASAGPPTNAANFAAIITRLSTLFS
jgi:phage baseplate assembly protein V